MLENKLGITNSAELAREEERLSKLRAVELYEKDILKKFSAGTFKSLSAIHYQLFQDVYDFAGKIRTVNIAKGNFRFAPLMYLKESLKNIEKMPQSTFDEIVEKYIEMNIAYLFREGNGRSTRIWLDCILKEEIMVRIMIRNYVCQYSNYYFLNTEFRFFRYTINFQRLTVRLTSRIVLFAF